MIIDIHSHFLPDTVIAYIREHGDKMNSEIVKRDGREFVWDKTGSMFPIYQEYYDFEKKTADMRRYGIDMAIMSVVPNAYYYWAAPQAAYEIAQICNDWVSDFCRRHPWSFCGMATVPMQDPNLALRELRRAHETLGLKFLAAAPIIRGIHLDAKEFFPIYQYCEAENILMFLHPCFPEEREELKQYYNINLIGNICQTTLGIDHLIFGGVFEQFPSLRVLTSHGGGFFPYQAGRFCRGATVRQETRVNIQRPESYFRNIYFDTITHWTPALQFLIDQFGSDHVMLGTDYPFDMGDYQAVSRLCELKISEDERDDVCFKNALQLLN